MNEHTGELAALRQVIAEERRLEPEQIDWARLEESLERKLREPERAVPQLRRLPIALAFAAAAAIGVGSAFATVSWLRGPEQAGSHHGSPRASALASNVVRGDALRAGSELTAEAKAVEVEHPGHAHWTLLPGSQAAVKTNDTVIELELERGAVEVAVVPQPVPETFVVLTANVRVAVHGTKFRVTRASDHVEVTVREGVVAVGPRGQAASVRLPAPSSALFEPDGSQRSPEAAQGDAAEGAESPKPTSSAPGIRGAAHKSLLPLEPSIADVEAGVSRVVQITQRCFGGHMPGGPDLEVTVRTTVRLGIQADGRIRSTSFDPPLAPGVQACADQSIRELRVAKSQRGIDVTRVLELKR